MNAMLAVLSIILLVVDAYLAWRLRWSRRESLAREKRAYENVESLILSLNTTTANLEKQNSAVHELLAEKRSAWGLSEECVR